MKTIRLASLTALISSVVFLDYADAGDMPPASPMDEQLAHAQLDMDDSVLQEDADEFTKDKEVAHREKKKARAVPRVAEAPAPEPEATQEPKKFKRKTIGGTRPLHRREQKL